MKTFTFDDLLDSYFSERWLKERSRVSYRVAVKLFRRFIGQDKLPGDVTREDVQEWRNFCFSEEGRNLTHQSWNNYCRHNRILFKHAIDHACIETLLNPFVKMEVRPPSKKKKTISKKNIVIAREAIDLHKKIEGYRQRPSELHPAWFWEIVFETFYHTGIRLTQLLSMKPEDIDLKSRVITATWQGAKNSREHYVPISKALYPHMNNLMNSAKVVGIKRGEQIFNVNRFSIRHRSEVMDSWQVESFFQKLSRICGCRLSPHRFRHTLGTELMREPDRNLHIVKNLLGHTNINTTLEYIEVDVCSIRNVLEDRV